MGKANWLTRLGREYTPKRPTQLREKSHQWFEEVRFLSKHDRRAAAVYLGGFVIELLLKSLLWHRRSEPKVGVLLHRLHDLEELLLTATDVSRQLASPANTEVRLGFQRLASWSVRVRYNPAIPSKRELVEFVHDLREVRTWLLGRV